MDSYNRVGDGQATSANYIVARIERRVVEKLGRSGNRVGIFAKQVAIFIHRTRIHIHAEMISGSDVVVYKRLVMPHQAPNVDSRIVSSFINVIRLITIN